MKATVTPPFLGVPAAPFMKKTYRQETKPSGFGNRPTARAYLAATDLRVKGGSLRGYITSASNFNDFLVLCEKPESRRQALSEARIAARRSSNPPTMNRANVSQTTK
jgi:hypothetical protein